MTEKRSRKSPTGVFTPIQFPCGAKVLNRLVKAPMYEHLAGFLGGPPNEYHIGLYSLWSRYNWGMVITGNVQVSKSHLTLGRDLVVPSMLNKASLKPYESLARAIRGPNGNTLAILQLSHAGRQSTNLIGGRLPFERPLAPSAISVGGTTTMDDAIAAMMQSVLFQTPKEMSTREIDEVVEGFVKGAQLAHEAGFDGIELHAAHGYLLAQFLSPKSNKRSDEYSIRSEEGLRLLHRIVNAIRSTVPTSFIVGVKLNASDYLVDVPFENGQKHAQNSEEERALQHVLDIAKWRAVDFIDVSGGDYENPEFMMSDTTKHSRRQALFARFSQRALQSLNSAGFTPPTRPVIILTGGLRTPNLLQSALESGQTDLVGIGRGAIVCPQIPDVMRQYEQYPTKDGDLPFAPGPEPSTPALLQVWPISPVWSSLKKLKLIGAGLDLAWYTVMIRRLALADLRRRGGDTSSAVLALEKPDYTIDGLQALFQMFLWIPDPRRDIKLSPSKIALVIAVLGLLAAGAAKICIYLVR